MLIIGTPIIFVLLIIFILLGNQDATIRPIKKLLNQNNISVVVEDQLVLDSVKIYWNIDYMKPVIVYEAGETTFDEIYEYGKNYFTVYYGSHLLTRYTQQKNEKISGHSYAFKLYYENDKCFRTTLKITGDFNTYNNQEIGTCQ